MPEVSLPGSADPGRWLLLAGAGASVAAPAGLPAFRELSAQVLRSIGWTYNSEDLVWRHPRYPPFPAPVLASEVLFGVLRGFGVEFAEEIARALVRAEPNAVHFIAARLLERGCPVWTPNVDLAIEAACGDFVPHRVGRVVRGSVSPLLPLLAAAPGSLVKFHGTAEAARTLAFTDRELMTPLPDAEVEHLAALADGRTVVVYGYAGADADLAELLEVVLGRAAVIVWFEPSEPSRRDIGLAFPGARIRFVPRHLPGGWHDCLRETAGAFVDLAGEAGIGVPAATAELFMAQPGEGAERERERSFSLRPPAGITHARLVERFGRSQDQGQAIRAARQEDLAALRIGSLPGHVRWAISRSLYSGGLVASAVRMAARHRWTLGPAMPRPLRDYIVTREAALLLTGGDWRGLAEFSDWAIQRRRLPSGGPYPSDLYYRAHASRYFLQPAQAGQDARDAAAGLTDVRDPERLAGALYEAASAAIYQGQFDDALRWAFQLRFRRGRYAIPRWQGWGAWLAAVAHCHKLDLRAADLALTAAEEVFGRDDRPAAHADVRTIRLLAARLKLALGRPLTADDDAAMTDPPGFHRVGRQQDDLDLILADILIAQSDEDAAMARYQRVADRPSCPVAAAWAALGLAEIQRRRGLLAEAGRCFADLAQAARACGAMWLEAQAAIGMDACGDGQATQALADVRRRLPRSRVEPIGEPRVLWTVTI